MTAKTGNGNKGSLNRTDTGSPAGLSDQQVADLQRQYGFNDIAEEKKHPFLKFLSYFWGPIPWMIEAAAVLSAFINHWEDFSVILFLLMINAVVGFFQERKAENSIELLKRHFALNGRVLRNGTWQVLPARELVPGDTVHVRLGDIVPADLELVRGGYLLLDESALTGESLPVEKKAGEKVYSGSVIRQGEMDAKVTATGSATFFGRTTNLMQQKPPHSHFQQAVIRIGNYLIVFAAVLVSLVLVVAFLRSEPLIETLQFALVLVVAAIPVALPAVLTVTLAVGAVALSKKEAIVSRLTAIEEIAGMDILCSDKTGTITLNHISVGGIRAFDCFSEDDLITAGALASRVESNDPIDSAILARYAGLKKPGCPVPFETLSSVPFDPVSKFSKAVVRDSTGRSFQVAKGAPQAIAQLAQTDAPCSKTIDGWVNDFAAKGYRALGVARTDATGKWQYIGVIGLFDPPRDDSEATLAEAGRLGVNVKMVTGDHIAIAKEIASRVGLGTKIITQSEFVARDDRDALGQMERSDGFAQVFPENKFHIVKVLQDGDHIVGMTGDGVNDAPALREADTGIAVAGATDAAKSAADIVLTKPGLSVIIDAIQQSRAIFRRMENYAVYRIAETVRVLIFLTLCIILLNFYPVTALMIVVLALLNDLPIMMIAYDNAPVAAKPVRWQMNRILTIASILGLLGVLSSFLLLWIAREYYHLDPGLIQTLIFLKLAVAGHMTIYLARTGQQHFWERPLPSLPLFGTAEITQIGATLIAVYGLFMTPIGWTIALLVWGYALAFFVVNDLIKVYLFRLVRPYS
jgi:H+-transporting ATPase